MHSNEEPSLEELLEFQSNLDKNTRNMLLFNRVNTMENINKEKKNTSQLNLNEADSFKKINKKRANKNRPRELSSKIPVKIFNSKMKKQTTARDPRFDSLCGRFDEHFFRDNYSFLDEIKKKEKHELVECLRNEVDPSKQQQIQFLLRRIRDQEREKTRKALQEKKRGERAEKIKKMLLEGKPAHFKTKSERKLCELVDKYEELKSKGKLQRYMKKKLKKTKRRDNVVPFK